jgi:hypothetical protein
MAGVDKDELPHGTTALESDCDMSQWHIARISHRSNYKCHAQQRATNFKCTARIAKSVQRNANAPTAEYRNKWESARNIKGTVLGIAVLPFPSLRTIISLKSGVEPDKKVYRITISHFPKCTCPKFFNMAVALLGKQGQYVNCKHLYYIFRYFCKINCQDNKFIHSLSLSFTKVKQLLVRAQIIIVNF